MTSQDDRTYLGASLGAGLSKRVLTSYKFRTVTINMGVG